MNETQGVMETEIEVELTIRSDGRIWANDKNGKCVLRIQGIDERKIAQFQTNNRFVDLRIRDDERIFLIAKNENETRKAHSFLSEHILYQGHKIDISTRQLTRTLTCDCGAICNVKMIVAPEGD